MADEFMYCHRCNWHGPWEESGFSKCADGCCDIDVCPKCGLELSNYPYEEKESSDSENTR